jgi:hypothetical protein
VIEDVPQKNPSSYGAKLIRDFLFWYWDQQMEHIKLPIIHEGKRKGIEEVIEAEKLGNNRYRLVTPPAWVEGLAIGDIFDIDDHELSGFVVLQHSGFLTIWIAFASQEQCGEHLDSAALKNAFAAIDGIFNGFAHQRFAIFSVPVTAGFTKIDQIADKLVESIPESTWQYANVYDWDGRALDWWRSEHP